MTKSKKRKLPKVETMIIWVAVISFALWAMSKCSKDDFKDIREKSLELPGTESAEATSDTITLQGPGLTAPMTPSAEAAPPTASPQSSPATIAAVPTLSRLYVTIDNLKMRSEPTLTGPVIERLSLYSTVYFMNEVTDSTQKINLGYAEADEPWVKVKSAKGKVGWVYGAGVHYYKVKNKDAY